MRHVPDAPVFTTDDALAAGWTASALKHAVERGRLRRIRRGVYSAATTVTHRHHALAAGRAVPRAVVSHRSALVLHDLPLVGREPPEPEVTVRPRSGATLQGMHVHRAGLRLRDIVLLDETATTSIARTLIDVARHRSLAAAVAAIDAALCGNRVTEAELIDVLEFCWNWPRIRRAQQAVALGDGRAESPLESVSRLTIGQLGLPAPVPQKWIFDRYGRLVARGDFYWDEFGVVGEADGRSKYTDGPVLTREKDRQEELEDLGLVVVRWGWEHVTRRPNSLRVKLQAAFERGRARDRSGFPRLWTL